MAKQKSNNLPSNENVEEFEMLFPLLESLMMEVKALSQKKQDGALNPLKVKMINKVLSRIKNLLKDDPSSEFIELLDEETLPTNSDALFMIVQFKSAMEQFKNKYYVKTSSGDFMSAEDYYSWKTKD